MPSALVYFDGACLGNPGPMGAGAVVEMDGARKELSRPLGRGTNNQAEYGGLILGLTEALEQGADEVTVRGDSQLILRQLEGRYRVKAPGLKALHDEAGGLLGRFRKARLEWIPRAENADADRLAGMAASTAQR